MLEDIERKLLRILANYLSRHNSIPTMEQLETMTGRRKGQIIQTLTNLEKQKYILWENKSSVENIQILEAWERGREPANRRFISSNIDYWTQY